jgi:parallel beta-helix repeat protein
MSWGSDGYSALTEGAVEYAYNKGVVLVGAAGNDNTAKRHYPSGFEHVISVGATNKKDERWTEEVESWWGPFTVGSNYGEYVDVSAPGENILSTVPLASMEGLYTEKTGTSMACPHVAGVAALLLANNPSLTPDMVKAQIRTGVDQINTDKEMGTGRINAYKALTLSPIYSFLDQIVNWDDVKGTFNIEGSAYGDDFSSYELVYGLGKDPNEWEVIESSTNSIFHGTLGTLNTNNLFDGAYTIKLTVETNDGTLFSDTKSIVVNNFIQTIYADSNNLNEPWDGTSENPFKELQDALDFAGRKDTVYVKTGTYQPISYTYWGALRRKGTFYIDREITLKGEDRDTTIITHEGKQDVRLIKVTADNVEISDLTIKSKGGSIDSNGGIEILSNNNYIHDNYFSTVEGYGTIRMEYSSGNIIEDNIFTSDQEDHRGVCMAYFCENNIIRGNTFENQLNAAIGMWYFCENNLIEDNEISDPYFGIIVYGECNKNIIQNNKLTNCNFNDYSSHSGILLTWYSSENRIIENEIFDGKGCGIYLEEESNDNIIHKNKIKNNARYGIHLDHYWVILLLAEPATYCRNNIIYQNVLAGNQLTNARDDGANNWYKNNIGNYYDDYDGEDKNNDKIGDTNYIIEGVRICIQLNPYGDSEEILRLPITHNDKFPLMDPEGKSKNILRPYEKSLNHLFQHFLNLFQKFNSRIEEIFL